jgi:hypothetical protein
MVSSLQAFRLKLCIPHLSHECYTLRPCHPPWLGRSNIVWWKVKKKILKISIMSFSPSSCSFLSLLQPGLRHPHFMSFPQEYFATLYAEAGTSSLPPVYIKRNLNWKSVSSFSKVMTTARHQIIHAPILNSFTLHALHIWRRSCRSSKALKIHFNKLCYW